MTDISVIVAAYNAERTIGETLASVTRQTRPPDEIIVIDDGSTDSTPAIAAAASPLVRVIRQPNRGAAAATNAGIAAATGDLLAFIDADNLWERDRLERQVQALAEQPEVDGVAGYVRAFLCPSVPPDQKARYRVPVTAEPCWFIGAMLLRRKCFTLGGLFEEELRAGYHIDWIDRARRAGLLFAMLDAVVLHRRIRPGSLGARSVMRDTSMIEMARRAIARRRTDCDLP